VLCFKLIYPHQGHDSRRRKFSIEFFDMMSKSIRELIAQMPPITTDLSLEVAGVVALEVLFLEGAISESTRFF